ncbi:transcriptional repressor LexA [Pelobacter propionicus]|uniref:LexA repressor n=1 Tax=Pelobacter propionicus (strain DSM 2379 / NBRC 103807 / OttBd1) TaxID=338966 RepID=A1AQ91_PELPD|nr:transcriptional repressor LexA [Pelobacter propionicus]ABK99511.1 SOS-response transcriptional repressor, LexA [Pelobacter propionicus DSM 2379]
MEALSPRQKQVLEFIRGYVAQNEYPPSLRDIGNYIGVSGNTAVLSHLEALERKGHIRRDTGSSRRIVLIRDKQHEVLQIPIVGTVQAGIPTLAVESIEGYYPMEKMQLRGGTFFLRVKGDSMINDAIMDGDLALIRPQETAENGDIVVALIEDEATLKRFYREGDFIRLEPSNTNFAVIVISAKDVTIIGKAIKIVRDID